MNAINAISLIEAKRDGQKLTPEAIRALVDAFTEGKLPDYQMAALLMAIYFRGMDQEETRALTLAMRDSGEVLEFPKDNRPLVDKHSTGGVGDKVSLPLAPLLAALGLRVPMISGRALGITGGTLDKLESIPGFNTQLTREQIVQQVQDIGCVICGQTERLVPADRALYALRDVTGTVPSIPLICASILSKKLAEGLEALLLDVKCGTAAFVQTHTQARTLAQVMVKLGYDCGVRTRALITEMSVPLGWAAGNWLEVKEAVQCLNGKGPTDLRDLVLHCAGHLLVLAGKARDLEDGRQQANACLQSGAALEKWRAMLAAQGADLDRYEAKLAKSHTAPAVFELKTWRAGYVVRCDARLIGRVIRDLGGGRVTKDTIINHDVGVDGLAKPGEELEEGSVLCRVHARTPEEAEQAANRLRAAFDISDRPTPATSLVLDVI